MEKNIRLNESQLTRLVSKVLKEQFYPSLDYFNKGLKFPHVENVCFKNNVKGCAKDGLYTNFDKDYDYKLSKGVWYTKSKGSTDWIDLTNHPNQNIRRKSLEILNQKIAKIKKGGQVVKKDDKVIKKDDKIVKKDSNYNCIAISKDECSKISPTQDVALNTKEYSETRCAAYMHKCLSQYDSQLGHGNAWTFFVNNKGLGPIKYNMYSDGTINWNQIYKDLKNNKINKEKCENLDYEKSDKEKGNVLPSIIVKNMPSKSGVSLKSLELGDMVGIYLPSSYNKSFAFCERVLKRNIDNNGNVLDKDPFTFNTHVGFVGAIKNGVPIIIHNIHGIHHATPATKLLSSTGKDGMITWVLGDNNIKQSIAKQKTQNSLSRELTEHFKSVHKKKTLVEQKPDYLIDKQSNDIMHATGIRSNSDYEKVKKIINDVDTSKYQQYYNKYKCLPENFRVPFGSLIKEGYNKEILKAALGIIGRESTYTNSKTYNLTYLPKLLVFFTNRSLGPAQMKPTTAMEIGALYDNILSMKGSLKAVYKYLIRSYKMAKQKGYSTTTPSVNLQTGTGNAALDISIGSYNFGIGRIIKYCETNDPNIKKNCEFAGKTVDSKNNIITNPNPKIKTYKVSNKYVPNYFPKIGDTSVMGKKLTSEGYVSEVAKSISSFNCV